MVPLTVIASCSLGTSHPGACRLRVCWRPQVLSRERWRGYFIHLPLALVPLSHSNQTPYPSAIPYRHPSPWKNPAC